MAWPTTKATTTHLDAETDDPNQARPQIKQNIDNVNSIIDFFPAGVNLNFVVLEMTGAMIGGSTGLNVVSEHYDPGAFSTLSDSDSQFTLSSGTYIMDHEAITGGQDTIQNFKNITAGSTVVASNPIEIGTTNQSMNIGLSNTVFTSNGTDKFAFNYPTFTPSNSADPRDGLRIKFTKIN